MYAFFKSRAIGPFESMTSNILFYICGCLLILVIVGMTSYIIWQRRRYQWIPSVEINQSHQDNRPNEPEVNAIPVGTAQEQVRAERPRSGISNDHYQSFHFSPNSRPSSSMASSQLPSFSSMNASLDTMDCYENNGTLYNLVGGIKRKCRIRDHISTEDIPLQQFRNQR